MQNTQSAASAAMRDAQADLSKLSFKEVRFDIDRLHARFDDLVSALNAGLPAASDMNGMFSDKKQD